MALQHDGEEIISGDMEILVTGDVTWRREMGAEPPVSLDNYLGGAGAGGPQLRTCDYLPPWIQPVDLEVRSYYFGFFRPPNRRLYGF